MSKITPIKPNYDLPWVRGWEYVIQEGSSYIQHARKARGWTRENVWDLSDGVLDPATQALIEGDYGIGHPWEIDQLVTYAVLFETTPGRLLDTIYETKGTQLLAEDRP